MPEQFGFKERMMHRASELSPVDKALQKRAEWVINETGVENHLQANGRYLDVGTGKGHITQRIIDDMEKSGDSLKGYYSIDVADKPLKKVQKRETVRKDKGTAINLKESNPMNFSWATAEALPFADKSMDGVSYFFSIHHMDKAKADEVMAEAKRVLNDDGRIFIVEDVVETEEERELTEEVDRKLNWESKDVEHSYKSNKEW